LLLPHQCTRICTLARPLAATLGTLSFAINFRLFWLNGWTWISSSALSIRRNWRCRQSQLRAHSPGQPLDPDVQFDSRASLSYFGAALLILRAEGIVHARGDSDGRQGGLPLQGPRDIRQQGQVMPVHAVLTISSFKHVDRIDQHCCRSCALGNSMVRKPQVSFIGGQQ
jgi:hypothetical protein